MRRVGSEEAGAAGKSLGKLRSFVRNIYIVEERFRRVDGLLVSAVVHTAQHMGR